MKTSLLAVTAFAIVTANAAIGCAAPDDAPATAASSDLATADLSPNLSEDIARLQALQVVNVDALSGYFHEGENCYGSQIPTSIGWICPKDVASLADTVGAADARLDAFVVAAEDAAAHATARREPADVQRDLAALRDLHIVAVSDFILDEPEDSNCYNRFCLDSNAVRAGKLHAIVEAAEQLK